MMKTLRRYQAPLAVGLFFLGLYLVTLKPVFLLRNGVWTRVLTHASSVAVALRDAGVEVESGASPIPGWDAPVAWGTTIEVPSGRMIPLLARGEIRYIAYPEGENIPLRQLLQQAGFVLSEGEWIFADGVPLLPDQVLKSPPLKLEIRKEIAFQVIADGTKNDYRAPGPTVGEALWEAGVVLRDADEVIPSPLTLLESIQQSPIVVEIVRARSLLVHVDGKDLSVRSAGKTVGEALARAGLSLAGLDYSVPAEDGPIPEDGAIRIVRVREEILRGQSPIPFERGTQPLADLELDQTRVLQPGALGIMESTIRVRYEDGVEVQRTHEGQQVVLPPQKRIVGYGTKIVIHTVDTPDGTFEYYRAITVYATSYSPCQLGVTPPRCSYTTRSGKPMQKGIIAMVDSWYRIFQGQGVYVDGYGPATVEDSGLGPNAPYWIDLAYPDPPDYVGWHRNTTLYFLKPVPANVPWILP
jgi:uncharacterized protein YabE (DUF348 family)